MSSLKHISRKARLAKMAEKQAYDRALNLSLKSSKPRFKRLDQIICQLYDGENLQSWNDEIHVTISACFDRVKKSHKSYRRRTFKELLLHLFRVKSKVLGRTDLIEGVFCLNEYNYKWITSFETYKPKAKSAYNQFIELVNHLLCKYKVPVHLYGSFFLNDESMFITWLIHLGKGGGMKTINYKPIPMTKKMGHLFSKAPAELNSKMALRWAQSIALGANKILADRIAHSWLGRKEYANEFFWEKFILILINGEPFNHRDIDQLLDYLRFKLQENAEYHLKGRNFSSLQKQSNDWHIRMHAMKTFGMYSWDKSEIDDFEYDEEVDNQILTYKIIEINHSKGLMKEGGKMKHCVGTYFDTCKRGRTAIFTIRKFTFGLNEKTLATVEVAKTNKNIVQAKAKRNEAISTKTRQILEMWAMKEGLTMGKYL